MFIIVHIISTHLKGIPYPEVLLRCAQPKIIIVSIYHDNPINLAGIPKTYHPKKIKLESNKGHTFSPRSQLIWIQSTHLMVKPTIVIFTPTPRMNKVPQKTTSFVVDHYVSELLTFSFQGYPLWLFHHFFFARASQRVCPHRIRLCRANLRNLKRRWMACALKVMLCFNLLYIYIYKYIHIYNSFFTAYDAYVIKWTGYTCVNMIKSVQM